MSGINTISTQSIHILQRCSRADNRSSHSIRYFNFLWLSIINKSRKADKGPVFEGTFRDITFLRGDPFIHPTGDFVPLFWFFLYTLYNLPSIRFLNDCKALTFIFVIRGILGFTQRNGQYPIRRSYCRPKKKDREPRQEGRRKGDRKTHLHVELDVRSNARGQLRHARGYIAPGVHDIRSSFPRSSPKPSYFLLSAFSSSITHCWLACLFLVDL